MSVPGAGNRGARQRGGRRCWFSLCSWPGRWLRLAASLRFRIPRPVTEIHRYADGSAYAVCPRCHVTLEWDYQRYCSRCGQALDWRLYDRAVTVRMR